MPKYRVKIIERSEQVMSVVALNATDAGNYALAGANVSDKQPVIETRAVKILSWDEE